MAVAEACRNVVCVGAEPVGLSDCLNFGSPERPEIMRQLARAIDGIASACHALGVPIVSGNVSLYNETDGRAILPTPTMAAVGLIRDPGDIVGATFPRDGLAVLLLGAVEGGPLGGSEYVARHTSGEVKGRPPCIDLSAEAALQRLVLELLQSRPRLLESAHDVSEGGLAVALAECSTATDDVAAMVGARITLPDGERIAAALFGEAPSRIVVSAEPNNAAAIEAHAKAAGVLVTRLGDTGGDRLVLSRRGAIIAALSLAELRDARERCLVAIVGD
jgi:phosphoribosylformylglycinamidine synthase